MSCETASRRRCSSRLDLPSKQWLSVDFMLPVAVRSVSDGRPALRGIDPTGAVQVHFGKYRVVSTWAALPVQASRWPPIEDEGATPPGSVADAISGISL